MPSAGEDFPGQFYTASDFLPEDWFEEAAKKSIALDFFLLNLSFWDLKANLKSSNTILKKI